MPPNQISKAFNTPLKKRLAVGAVSVLTAGALLGVGVAGASAAPLSPTSATTSATPSSASPAPDAGAKMGHAFASLKRELRADLSQGQNAGEKAQKIAATIVGHTELFAKLPANLQTDLTTLKNASATARTADALKIKTTALSGGYGEDIKKLAIKIQKDPKRPLAAALRGLVHGQHAGQSALKIATTLIEHPKIFAKLPANLQADLMALKNAPAADQAADAQKIETTALNGGYGQQIQKIAERFHANIGAHTDAGAHAKGGS